MEQELWVEGLLELLHDLQQMELFDQLEKNPRLFMRWKLRTEAQWKKILALKRNASGFSDIYNYLHPRNEGI
jgi:hypothetical protein